MRRTPFTTSFRRGDVVLVSFPFTDLTSTKRRPAVVVSPDSFNRRGADLVLVAITSQLHGAADRVELRDEDVEDGSLPKPSDIRFAKIFTLHSSIVVKRICRLTPAKTGEVLDRLAAFFSPVGAV